MLSVPIAEDAVAERANLDYLDTLEVAQYSQLKQLELNSGLKAMIQKADMKVNTYRIANYVQPTEFYNGMAFAKL